MPVRHGRHDRHGRDGEATAWAERARAIGLFRYQLIREAADHSGNEYLTCGLGVKASKTSQAITDSWRFVTPMRVGTELQLAGPERVPHGPAQLRDLIGADCMFEEPAFLVAIGDFNFLYATGVLMLVSVVVMVVISLMTQAPSEAQTRGLTYGSIHHLAGDEIKGSWDFGNKLMAGLIILLVGGMYLYFSFWLT